MSWDADTAVKGIEDHDASTQTDTTTNIIILPFVPEASTCTRNKHTNSQDVIGDDVTETILTPENAIDKSVQTIDVIAAKENYPRDTLKELFDITTDEDQHERILMASDDGAQAPWNIFDQIADGKQTTDPAEYLPCARNDVNQKYYTGQHSSGVQHEQQHCPAAQKHNDNIFLESDDELLTSNINMLQVRNEEGKKEKSKSAQIFHVVKEKARNTGQLREVTDELSLSIPEPLCGSFATDNLSIRSALYDRSAGSIPITSINGPGAYSIPGIEHHLASGCGEENVENHIGVYVQHAIPCAEGCAVEPVFFAEVKAHNCTLKNVMISVLMFVAFFFGVLIIIISRSRSLTTVIKSPETNLMNIENISMTLEGKVMSDFSNAWLLWANVTSTHVQDFYASNEGFGVNILSIETIYLEDIFLKRQELDVTEIRYSQFFNFTAEDKFMTADDIATIPFSTRKAKNSYIISLKEVRTMFSGIYTFVEIFFMTFSPTEHPSVSMKPTISILPTAFLSLHPTIIASETPSTSFSPTAMYTLDGWLLNDTANWCCATKWWNNVAFSDDYTWMAKSDDRKDAPLALHNTSFGEYVGTTKGLVTISRLNSNLDFVVSQYIYGMDYMAEDFGSDVKMSADGTMLTISAPLTDNITGALFVFCRDGLTQPFTFQQKLNGEEEIDSFGRMVSITPDGLVVVVLTRRWSDTGSLYIFSRNLLECKFSLVQKIVDQITNCANLNLVLSADGMTLIYGAVCSASYFRGEDAVYILSRKSRIDEFYFQQRLDGKEGEYFGYQLDVSRSGNLLVIAAPYASPEDFLNAGSLHVFIRGKGENFTHANQIDGVCDYENLGYNGVHLQASDTGLNILSLSTLSCDISKNNYYDPDIRLFSLVCNCSNKDFECSGFSKFPDLVCQDIL
eukprot:CAMPEP_0194413362 /NCGR_PEP_ID=MMETSP0176-20130528/11901_1 /TAXON_ID=216777 /ORGANISM="Proboscia alata, Strain PI-D3" /LENGTH=906 /DNA_ID=CAMNT_0039216677 /DNA_START=77 /DNA_END=2797 /DNA_ORIENTATION=-